MEIPHSAADLGPGWLTEALRQRHAIDAGRVAHAEYAPADVGKGFYCGTLPAGVDAGSSAVC